MFACDMKTCWMAIGVISTTGAGGLSPDPQPVTEVPAALSL